MTKVGRNDPCPCGSGKKFKKCCEEKQKSKKFSAQLLSNGLPFQPETTDAAKVSSSFFKRAITQVNPKPIEPPEEMKSPVL
jgi:hypothetical protein